MTEITDQLGDATTILLAAPSMGDDTGACVDLLTRAVPEETSVLWVSFTKPADECLAQWRAEHDADPGDFGMIVVGETVGPTGAGDVRGQAVQTISNASDLTGIGIKVDEFVSGRDEEIAVCFDSLTTLLQYVDLETAYEFLHALTGKLYSVGARSHFHIDPSAHDEQTIDTLLSLFDARVDLGTDDPVVRTRALVE